MAKIQKGIYRHYKGKDYEVIDVARHSEDLEDMVVVHYMITMNYGPGRFKCFSKM